MSLKKYIKKRKFSKTPEPKPKNISRKNKKPIFVIQKHQARNLHYDLRLEFEGVLKSWAIPKKPPKKRLLKRLAIQTEDHPLDYASFKGKIPKGEYGAGMVEIWDKGFFNVLKGDLKKGSLQFKLAGDILKGIYNLVQLKKTGDKNWLLFKSK